MILCGIHPPPGCDELPRGGVGLDNVPLNASVPRFHQARELLKHWQWDCEDEQAEGRIPRLHLSLYELIRWCEDFDIETEWLPVFQDLMGYRPDSNSVDFIPSEVAAYASQTAHSVNTILNKLESIKSDIHESPTTEKPPGRAANAQSPMPIPANREHLSTDEFAAVLAVAPQSVRKRYSETGSYHGVRPTKMPNRRLFWPVDAVRRLLVSGSR